MMHCYVEITVEMNIGNSIVGKEYSKLMERNVRRILKINPCSPVHYFDSVLALKNLSMWSWRFGNYKEFRRLRDKAATLAQKHNLVTMRFIILWQDFLVTHDYDNMQYLSTLFAQRARPCGFFKFPKRALA
jgi:hypothetical protein